MTNICCIGDCYTTGLPRLNDYNYPEFLSKMLGEGYRLDVLGRESLTITGIVKHKNLFLPKESKPGDIAILWIGTNDLFLGYSPEDICCNYDIYHNELNHLGITVFDVTAMPRIDTPRIEQHLFVENKKKFNTFIKEKYSNVIRIDENASVGIKKIKKDLCEKNEFGIIEEHFNKKGLKTVAKIFYNEIRSL